MFMLFTQFHMTHNFDPLTFAYVQGRDALEESYGHFGMITLTDSWTWTMISTYTVFLH